MEFKLPHYQTTTRYQSNNYKRQCKNGVSFAESLLKCGFYQDTTLKSATRAESRDQRVVKRKKSSMDRLSSEFEKEAQKVRELQSQLALRQQEMALVAYQLYSATYIQSIYRGWKARRTLKKLFLKRFLRIFLIFRQRFKKIRRAQICISRSYRHWVVTKRFLLLIRICCASIRIQRAFRCFFHQRRAIIRIVSYRLWNHIELFAITRVKKVFHPLERHRYVLNAFIGEYMRRKRLLRLGNKLTCFRIFYSLFHLNVYPSYDSHISSSPQALSPLPLSLSMDQIAEREFRHEINIAKQSKNELLTFLKSQHLPLSPPHSSSTHHKSFPDLLSKEIKMNPNKKFQSLLDPISLIHNEITTVAALSAVIPTPFILSGSAHRFRSLRETVLFLMDLKQKAHQYPEALESPPPLTYVTNTPRMKRAMSQSLARKASLNVKLIPPSLRPFAAELIVPPENLVKKEADKLTGLRKIHQLRNLRSNSSGQQQTSLLPKPPLAPPKNLPSSRLLITRKKPSRSSPAEVMPVTPAPPPAILIPSQQLSETSLHKSDLLSSQEMISAPQTAEAPNPIASLNSNSLTLTKSTGPPHPAPQDSSSPEHSEMEESDCDDQEDSSLSDYSQDEDFELDPEETEVSRESLMPLRPSQPPPSFFKRRQNIALHSIVPLFNLLDTGAGGTGSM